MFGLKMLGSLLVLLSSAGLGALQGAKYKQRIRSLSEMRRLFMLLDGEIRNARTPVPDAFLHMAERMSGPYCEFSNKLSEELTKMEGNQFAVIWKETVNEVFKGKDTGMSEEDIVLIHSFADTFGYLDARMQLDAIRFLQEQILDRMSALSATCTAQTRISRLLGISGGVFLVLLLL